MASNFSPSVNIIRDQEKGLSYIPTPNARRIYDQILTEYKSGIHSFNIIGSYGTGKSAFLLAFQQTLKQQATYFPEVNGQFKGWKDFEFLNIVGEYRSFTQVLGENLGLKEKGLKPEAILEALEKRANKLSKKELNFVLIIDEFGKFLEFAAKHNPDGELYLIQQIAEFANNPERNVMFLTTLHQGFDSYGKELAQTQQKEWGKVKGRLKELTFNEPVEQLLFLASERLAQSEFKAPLEDVKELFDLIVKARVFPLRAEISLELSEKLFPLDLVSAGVVAMALQKYGQNERSLFTFLESRDYLGLHEFDTEVAPFYNLAWVYDYLLHNYYSFLSTKYNPDYIQWSAIRQAVEKVEGALSSRIDEASQIVKTIGLLNVFSTAAASVDSHFIVKYASLALGIKDAQELVNQLEDKKIIRFVHHKRKFILFEGTDLDIDLALEDAGRKISSNIDVVRALKQYFDFPIISARRVSYEKGTPRFFKFILSENPTEERPEGEIDGIINLIFNEELTDKDLKTSSKENPEAVLFGLYQSTKEIKELLFEIEKTKFVLKENQDDWVARRELKSILAYLREVLNEQIREHLFSDFIDIAWIFQGKKISIRSNRQFNEELSNICDTVYFDAPIYRNELINRDKLPGALSKARRNLVTKMLSEPRVANLGFPEKKFPPEKTVYLTLLKNTGIHREEKGGWGFHAPTDPSIQSLWDHSNAFLEKARFGKKSLGDFVEDLTQKPIKVKSGFLDFWLPIFLIIKQEDYALYEGERLIISLSSETIDLIIKAPHKFSIKTFNVDGVRLDLFNEIRTLIQLDTVEGAGQQTFIETIRPFLSFYKGLPEYSKRTKTGVSESAAKLRSAIETAKDPEATFFEDFPKALGFGALELKSSEEFLADYVGHLKSAIAEIRQAYDKLLERVEAQFLEELGLEGMEYEDYFLEVSKRYSAIKDSRLLPHQKRLKDRLVRMLPEQRDYLSNIVQALIGKRLEVIKDEEEALVFDRISSTLKELDSLADWNQIEFDPKKEQVFKIGVNFVDDTQEPLPVRVPKSKESKAQKIEEKLTKALSGDDKADLLALANLLKKKLNHDEG